MPPRSARSSACSASPMSASSRLTTSSSGLDDRNWKPRSALSASGSRSSARMGVPFSSARRQRSRMRASCSSPLPAPFFRSRSMRSMRRSATARSARISSSSIALASRAASTAPAGMRHVGRAKGAHHVQQRVRFPVRGDIDEAARAGAARDVREHDAGGNPPARLEQRREMVEACVGHLRGAPRSPRRGRLARMSLPRPREISRLKSVVLPVEGNPMRPARSIRRASKGVGTTCTGGW